MSNKLQGCPVSAQMRSAGLFDWTGVLGVASLAVDLLQKQGPTAIHLVQTLIAGLGALSLRDYSGILAAINAGEPDVVAIIAAIKSEFGLE